MFGIPNVVIYLALAAALLGGVAWHEQQVSGVREAAIAKERARVALETEKLQNAERQRAAENAAQSEREALAEEHEDAERQRELEEANRRIEELEKGNKACVISRDTVRRLNSAR